MSIIKHIGKHGDQKVAIIFREVPGEEHMALVVYPDKLQRGMHDSIMRVLESTVGQEAETLGEPLGRELLSDGRVILNTLHKEGKIKKVRTQEIIVTPNATSHVRLDELNGILDGLRDGTAASKKQAELDKNSGMVDPVEKARDAKLAAAAGDNVLGDTEIGNEMLEQSIKLASDAEALLVESKRLKKEALKLNPELKPARKKRVSKSRVSKKRSSRSDS